MVTAALCWQGCGMNCSCSAVLLLPFSEYKGTYILALHHV